MLSTIWVVIYAPYRFQKRLVVVYVQSFSITRRLAGSGTTLAVASELWRSLIGVDCSETAINTILKRFQSGGNKMGDFVTKKTSSTKPDLFNSWIDDATKSKGKSLHQKINNFSFYLPTGLDNPFDNQLKELES